MKIKRYLGADMRDALRQIRAELGADAVLLSTRSTDGGVEVSAATDAALLVEPAAVALPPFAPAALTGAASLHTVASFTTEQSAMSEELRALRQLLERQLAALTWNDYTRREPLRARALAELTELGLARDVTLSVLAELPADLSDEAAQCLHLTLLARRLNVCESPLAAGGALALLGATGAGKTTMLAKLALRWLLEHGADGLSIVTIDDEHIGAAEQARSLGRLLGVPSFRFADAASFAAQSARFADQELLLIDTPALAAEPAAALATATALQSIAVAPRSMLLLPASAQPGVLDEVLRRAQPFAPDCCALTRCDEAVSFGGVLSVLARSRLPVALLSDGPRIPEDLKPARAQQLVARAAELARVAGASVDAGLLAQHFGSEINVAA